MKAVASVLSFLCLLAPMAHAHTVLTSSESLFCPDETYTLTFEINGPDCAGATEFLLRLPLDWWLLPENVARNIPGFGNAEQSSDGSTLRWRRVGSIPAQPSLPAQITVRAGLEEGAGVISWMILGAGPPDDPEVEWGMIPVTVGGAGCPSHEPRTWRVEPDGGGDFPTIQHAIDASGNGDVIELGDGIFRGPGNRNISFHGRRIAVRSRSGNPDICIVDCQKEAGGFLFNGGESSGSVLEGVTVANGRAPWGAGALCVGGSPTIQRCVFLRCVANQGGGGVWCASSQLVLRECLFTENGAPAAGGGAGLGCEEADPTIEGCEFRENTWNALYCNGGSPSVIRCTFTANDTGALLRGGSACFSNCTFAYNVGGAVVTQLEASPEFRNTVIAYTAMGPAFQPADRSPALTNCNLYANQHGDWAGALAPRLGVEGNISEDPLFAGASDSEKPLLMSKDSPCAGGWSGRSESIGVWPIGESGPRGFGSAEGMACICIDARYSSLGHCNFVIRFHLPTTTTGRAYAIEVVDRTGQSVRTLCRGNARPGCRMVLWDGRDDNGDSVPNGVYTCRIRCGKEEKTAQLALLW
jgi:hypothetical protein